MKYEKQSSKRFYLNFRENFLLTCYPQTSPSTWRNKHQRKNLFPALLLCVTNFMKIFTVITEAFSLWQKPWKKNLIYNLVKAIFPLYRPQSLYLHCRLTNWFLYDRSIDLKPFQPRFACHIKTNQYEMQQGWNGSNELRDCLGWNRSVQVSVFQKCL